MSSEDVNSNSVTIWAKTCISSKLKATVSSGCRCQRLSRTFQTIRRLDPFPTMEAKMIMMIMVTTTPPSKCLMTTTPRSAQGVLIPCKAHRDWTLTGSQPSKCRPKGRVKWMMAMQISRWRHLTKNNNSLINLAPFWGLSRTWPISKMNLSMTIDHLQSG